MQLRFYDFAENWILVQRQNHELQPFGPSRWNMGDFRFFSLSCFLKTPSGSKSDVILHIFLEEVLMNTFLPTEIDMKELSYK